MRFPLPLLLTGLAGLAAAGGLALDPPPARLELGGESARPRWVLVSWAQDRQKIFDVPAGSRGTVLTGVPQGGALVCGGGEGLATVCQDLFIASGKTVAHPGPTAGTRVVGRVLRGRRPVAGAEVWVRPEPYPVPWLFFFPLEREGPRGRLKHEARTDAQGRFAVPLLAPGTYRLRVALSEGRFEDGKPFTVVAAPAAPGPSQDVGDLLVPGGIEIMVVAIDRSGLGVGGTRVEIRQTGGRAESLRFAAETGIDGIAYLSDLDGNLPATVTCTKPGFEKSVERFQVVPGRTRCRLYRPSRITGKVEDTRGGPLPRARVSLAGTDISVETRIDGSFELGGIPAGDYVVVAVAPGFRAASSDVKVAPETQQELPPYQLQAAPRFHGVVVDALSRAPLAGADLEVTSPQGGGRATADEEGRFSFAVDAVNPEGDVGITAEAPEYPKTPFAVSRRERSSGKPVIFALWQGGRLRVTGWNEVADQPCGGCTVRWTGRKGLKGSQVTNSQGEVLSPLLPVDTYEVILEPAKAEAAVMTPKKGAATVYPGEVTPVRLGEPQLVVKVELVPAPPAGTTLWGSSRLGRKGGPAGADGRFSIRKPHGMAVEISIETPGATLSVRLAELPSPFARTSLRLALPGTAVSGKLRRAGAPLGGAGIALRSLADGKAVAHGWSDAAGAFQAAFVTPGAYALEVEGKEAARFELGEGGTAELGTVETAGPAP